MIKKIVLLVAFVSVIFLPAHFLFAQEKSVVAQGKTETLEQEEVGEEEAEAGDEGENATLDQDMGLDQDEETAPDSRDMVESEEEGETR